MVFVYINPESGEETEFHFRDHPQLRLKNSDFETCLVCGRISSHRNSLTDEETEVDNGIARISTASCFEWECGHCRAHHVEITAPILAECNTHISQEAMHAHDES